MKRITTPSRGLISIALLAVIAAAGGLLLTSGSAQATSAAQYEYGHPVPLTNPVLSGTPQVGQKLSVSNGTWSSSSTITYTYRWGRCDANAANCVEIAGAETNTYTLVVADQGHRIIPYVWATNSVGQTKADTTASPVIAAAVGTTTTTTASATGAKVIAAANVKLPNRLVIDKVTYSQNPIRSRLTPTQMRVHVVDGNGASVQSALVYSVGVPYSRIRDIPEVRTDATGWATMSLAAGPAFPRTGYLVLFVRTRVEGQDLLGGTSTRRLVQVTIGVPSGS